MKKRFVSTVLCAAMVAGSLAGCGLKTPETTAAAPAPETTTAAAAEETRQQQRRLPRRQRLPTRRK